MKVSLKHVFQGTAFLISSLVLTSSLAALREADISPEVLVWQNTLIEQARQHEGCYTGHYPDPEIIAMPCSISQNKRPYRVHHSLGNQNDAIDVLSSGTVDQAEARIYREWGVTKEYAQNDKGDQLPGVYTLQLNSNYFASPMCSGRNVAGKKNPCRAVQQFIYLSDLKQILEQYWLTDASNCPVGWTPFQDKNGLSCMLESAPYDVPFVNFTDLTSVYVTVSVTPGGNNVFTAVISGVPYMLTTSDNILGLGYGWTSAEYNVFGDDQYSEAVFNKGSNIQVAILLYGGPNKCGSGGSTSETNNLTLDSCNVTGGEVLFQEFRPTKK